jgi:hypothetical protein
MTSRDPIARVSVLSTGNVRIRPEHLASTWRPQYWSLLTSRRWAPPLPINVYVVEHRAWCSCRRRVTPRDRCRCSCAVRGVPL